MGQTAPPHGGGGQKTPRKLEPRPATGSPSAHAAHQRKCSQPHGSQPLALPVLRPSNSNLSKDQGFEQRSEIYRYFCMFHYIQIDILHSYIRHLHHGSAKGEFGNRTPFLSSQNLIKISERYVTTKLDGWMELAVTARLRTRQIDRKSM